MADNLNSMNLSRRTALTGGLTSAAGLIAGGAGAAFADTGGAANDPLVMAVQKLHAAFKAIDDRVPPDEDLDDDHPSLASRRCCLR